MSQTDERPQARRPRRWFQFGLRSLLIATALIAVLVVWQRPRIETWLAALRDKPASSRPILIIKIDSDGGFVLRDGHRDMDEFKVFLAREKEFAELSKSTRPRLFILANPAAPFDRVRTVMEIAREAGFSEIELHQDK